MTRIAIIDGVRTPYIKAWTDFEPINAVDLGRMVVREIMERTELDPQIIDEVIVGNVAQPVDAVNIARVIALYAGVPKHVPAYTVHRNCASGLQALSDGYEKIATGQAEVIVAAGVESMTHIPLMMPHRAVKIFNQLFRAKTLPEKIVTFMKFRPHHFYPVIGLEKGLTDPVSGLMMGGTAEAIAKEWHLSRKAQDEYALLSHQRASNATKEGRFREEIMPVTLPPAYEKTILEDNGIRHNQTMEALAKLKTIFDRSGYGTVTAGNSSQVTDGAAAVVLMSEEKAKSLGYKPLGYIRSYAYAGCDPGRMGMGPSVATPKALKRAGLRLKDIQLIEINEAFASVVLSNQKAWASEKYCTEVLGLSEPMGEMDLSITNVNGGAIALGHPVGSSGVRLVTTLLREMKRRNLQLGLATLCIGGGQGGAMVVERE